MKLIADIQKKIGEKEIKEILDKVGLEPNDKRKYKKYSLGMKQRLGIAAALMEQPDLVILDEPFNALDTDGVTMTANLIRNEKERGALVIMACHDREQLEFLADEIIEISGGKAAKEKKGE
ncbi:ATP-binding cassette domain-containing protein [Murimonas intestini]|uniref:ABC transporter family protein n=1 Tax=Murimonas intestini TaxID=1337051 RepID=A0AB73T5G5_9FIRM|nr:ATP-binding cassette domain-containing protein [Murimonas intestini]